ncbi:helix-turn-helix domain-containing protein [Verrucosispora sp. WMMD1129]|uniref:helix-turn-helix domain-containing protein n=1 Tax=Verrucosispora sp. WMMD1129 TaxID=3016093 RepID=UPI00249C44D1|nr:helix-turn-helix domain-containing protein [Verrucosispora sp. WMMD1129]WFE44272.1 helix-turn-helix domain-containing protein [Verrucosispora sp. WMMD1129]
MAALPSRAALVGQAVVIDAEVAARVLAVALRQARRSAARDGVTFDPALAEVLAVAEQAEQLIAARRSVAGTGPVPLLARPGSAAGGSVAEVEGGPVLGSVEVARLAGTSDRAVRKAARAGALAGRITGGRWVFTGPAVDRWMSRRRAGGGVDETEAAGRAGGGGVAGRAGVAGTVRRG